MAQHARTSAVEEHECADDHPVSVPREAAPAQDRVTPGQKHERRGEVVEHEDAREGADDVVRDLDRGLGRRRRRAGRDVRSWKE